jgi:serine protease Do
MLTSFLVAALLAGTSLITPVEAQGNRDRADWHVAQMQPQAMAEGAGYLGVRLADIDSERANALKLGEERGVEVKSVMEGSPADKAGIQPGDVILTYNGEQILGAQQLSRLVQETPPGRRVKLQYWREGKTLSAVVVVGAASSLPNGTPFWSLPMPNWQMPALPNWQAPSMDVPAPLLVWRNSVVGIEFERVDSQLAAYFSVKGGVLVRSVQRGSPAERAGLKAGDVIFSVAQQALSSEHEFSSLLRQHGSAVPVSVMRDHKRVDVTISLP